MKRLAIVTTHPIQYNAPLFRLLAERRNIELKVFYTWSQSANGHIYDPGFGIHKAWDIPLLEGYPFHFSENVSKMPGSHHFRGVINPDLIPEVEGFRPDAIMVYGWKFQSHLKLLRHFSRKLPIYFRGDSTLLNENGRQFLQNSIRRFVLRWVYSHIAHAFFAGEENRNYYLKHGLTESRLSFMPHAVDIRRFADAREEGITEIREQLGIPANELVFLYAGKFEAVKNPALLVNAFRAVTAPGLHLLMVGSGALEEELRATAKGNKNIHFLPFQNQSRIPAIYQFADVFVLPSRSETWGLAVNEAMAAGKAVLVSDKCGCAANLVNPAVNGMVFRSESVDDLSEKISRMAAAGKEGLAEMGSRSAGMIQEWSFMNCAEAIETKLNSEP